MIKYNLLLVFYLTLILSLTCNAQRDYRDLKNKNGSYCETDSLLNWIKIDYFENDFLMIRKIFINNHIATELRTNKTKDTMTVYGFNDDGKIVSKNIYAIINSDWKKIDDFYEFLIRYQVMEEKFDSNGLLSYRMYSKFINENQRKKINSDYLILKEEFYNKGKLMNYVLYEYDENYKVLSKKFK